MATYTGSPFGTIRGKFGNVVSLTYRGIKCIRADFSATQLNSLPQQKVKSVFKVLQKLGSRHYAFLLIPIWNILANSTRLPLSGINLLVKKSSRLVFKTTISGVYEPDWTKMLVSDGVLEATEEVIDVAYNEVTGALAVDWQKLTYRNGQPTDDAVILLFRAPYTGKLEGNSWILGANATRSAAGATVYAQPGLPAIDLTTFLFFSDDCANYSPSMSRSVMQPRDSIFHKEDALTGSWIGVWNKIEEFKILRRQEYRAYRLFVWMRYCKVFFRMKSVAEGDLDSNIQIQAGAGLINLPPYVQCSAQNEYISVEVYGQNTGSEIPRVEGMLFQGYEQ